MQRRTRQREAVNAKMSSASGFQTAQQIHDDLRGGGDPVGLATVYRTLQAMVSAGEVDAIRLSDGETAYRQCSTEHHHHLICRNCGRTVEVAGEAVESWANATARQHGFRDTSHELEIYGLCSDC